MAKGSLDAVTRALAMEYAKDGIRVNTVALGVIKTPMHKPETYEVLNGRNPIVRGFPFHSQEDVMGGDLTPLCTRLRLEEPN